MIRRFLIQFYVQSILLYCLFLQISCSILIWFNLFSLFVLLVLRRLLHVWFADFVNFAVSIDRRKSRKRLKTCKTWSENEFFETAILIELMISLFAFLFDHDVYWRVEMKNKLLNKNVQLMMLSNDAIVVDMINIRI